MHPFLKIFRNHYIHLYRFDRIFIDLKTLGEKEILKSTTFPDRGSSPNTYIEADGNPPPRVFEEFHMDRYRELSGVNNCLFTTKSEYIIWRNEYLYRWISGTHKIRNNDISPNNYIIKELKKEKNKVYRKALKKGMQQGMQQGLKIGMQQGIEKAQFEIIVKLFENGASIDFISSITGLPGK